MQLTIIDIIIILIVFQGVFFFFFLITHKKGKKTSNRLLALFVGSLTLHFANIFVTEHPKEFGIIPSFNPLLVTLYMPVLYFYARSLIYRDTSFKNDKILFHLAGNSILIGLSIYWIIDDYHNKITNQLINSLITIPVILQMLIYWIITYRAIFRYQKVLKKTQSLFDSISLSWIKFILNAFLFFIIVIGAEYVFSLSFVQNTLTVIIFISVLFVMNAFVYKGLKHPELFSGITSEENNLLIADEEIKEDSQEDLNRLTAFMETEKPYLNPELSLQDLADNLIISPRNLSNLLNSHLKQNFFEFVNTYRIEEAKKMLLAAEYRKYRINEIMYEVGFNSKSSFNTLFKRNTGLTPSDFRKKERLTE